MIGLGATQLLNLDLISVFAFCVTIDAMLNFDGDIDANADVKCK